MGKYYDYQKEVLNWSLWLSENGFFGTKLGTGGNVSMRIPGEEAAAMTPSSRKYSELTAADICIVDFEGKVLEGELKPTVEQGMHLAVYKNREKVNAVAHTHQTYASLLSVIGTSIPALFDEVAFDIGDIVEVVPYALSGSVELAANVAAKLGNNCNCYLIQNHGALNLGSSIEKACLHAEMLEKICMVYYHALVSGKEISVLPEPVIELVKALKG
ncbi:MAG TPA: class II aldolase/adducin family protein [Spirochaetes bacterium]|nr:class II aldolase/adducin family protein [Spirochaetota bacterium]